MRLCVEHWTKLTDALRARALWKYVAEDGESAMKGCREGSPDPLVGASMAIFHNSATAMVSRGYDPSEFEKYACPLCFFIEGCNCDNREKCKAGWETWIEFAANEQLKRYTEAQA